MKTLSTLRRLAWPAAVLTLIAFAVTVVPPLRSTFIADRLAPAPGLPAGTEAMRVRLDPETGGLSADLNLEKSVDAELGRMLSRSSRGLSEVYHADGHVSVHLDGRFMSASVARLAPNGKLETTCVESAEALESFLAGGKVPPAHDSLEVQ